MEALDPVLKESAFFVNEGIVETPERRLTGAQIKALSGQPADYQLYEERPGEKDRLIANDEHVEIPRSLHFITVPPANFG